MNHADRSLTWRQRLARWLDPGHYRVAARKAAICDKLFELQGVAIMAPESLHPEARKVVMTLLAVGEVSARTEPPPSSRRQ